MERGQRIRALGHILHRLGYGRADRVDVTLQNQVGIGVVGSQPQIQRKTVGILRGKFNVGRGHSDDLVGLCHVKSTGRLGIRYKRVRQNVRLDLVTDHTGRKTDARSLQTGLERGLIKGNDNFFYVKAGRTIVKKGIQTLHQTVFNQCFIVRCATVQNTHQTGNVIF